MQHDDDLTLPTQTEIDLDLPFYIVPDPPPPEERDILVALILRVGLLIGGLVTGLSIALAPISAAMIYDTFAGAAARTCSTSR